METFLDALIIQNASIQETKNESRYTNMIWIDKKAFEDTYAILKKEKTLEPVYTDLKQFIEDTFGITVFNIILQPIKTGLFDRIVKNSYLNGHKYKLICYVGSYAEREQMQNRIDVQLPNFPNAHKMVNDENKQQLILDKLFELSVKYNYTIKAKKDLIWVDYFYWFPTDYMGFIVSKVQKQIIRSVLTKYKQEGNIWEIHTSGIGIYIFYDTENNKLLNQQNGITEDIHRIIYTSIKELDEFDFYKVEYIAFDTKENLDKNYQGNLYYYFK